MALAYPTNLPIPLVTGYNHPDSQKVRVIMVETGVPRFELLSENGSSFPKVNWLFNTLEFQVFEGFYRHTLQLGSISFDMRLKVGDGLRLHECYFNKGYKPSLQGKLWKVTANLITVAKQYDTLEDFITAFALLAQLQSMVECGEELAACGEAFAECGNFTE